MSQQPYYFQIVPRAIISKSLDKQKGEFRFHVYKITQQVDFSKQPLIADFVDRKMNVKNAKLNFFLANYIAGKNTNFKFTFQLSKKGIYNDERSVGSYIVDPNIYIEAFKGNQLNHYAQLWQLSDTYSVEVELFFEESRYLLEKLLKQHRNNPAIMFNNPLVSKVLEKAKEIQSKEEQEYDNEEKFNQRRVKLLSKYSGAIVGQGGYRIFDEEEQNLMKKKSVGKTSTKYSEQQRMEIQRLLFSSQSKQSKKPSQDKNRLSIDQYQNPVIKRTNSIVIGSQQHEEFSPKQVKNIKYLILAVAILILAGCGYFMAKVFLKEQHKYAAQEEEVGITGKQVKNQKVKKSKYKGPKKTKPSSQQL